MNTDRIKFTTKAKYNIPLLGGDKGEGKGNPPHEFRKHNIYNKLLSEISVITETYTSLLDFVKQNWGLHGGKND